MVRPLSTMPAATSISDPYAIGAWQIALAAAAAADQLAAADEVVHCDVDADGLVRVRGEDDPAALISWNPGAGWTSLLPPSDSRHGLLDLYLPVCSATAIRPMTIGHLGLSLDGFIATRTGDSQFVTGHE